MVTKLQLEQAEVETAALRAHLKEQTKLEQGLKPLTDAPKKEIQESQVEAAVWKAKFEGFEKQLTALGIDINLAEGQKLAGISEEEWKDIEDSDGDFRKWQPERPKTYEEAIVDSAEVVGRSRREEMKKEGRLKEGFRAWDIELMKPYEEDSKVESNLQAML